MADFVFMEVHSQQRRQEDGQNINSNLDTLLQF